VQVSIVGLGYVGLVTAACLAERGHDVVGIEVDGARIAALDNGRAPFFEPDLDRTIESNVKAGRLRFSGYSAAAIEVARVVVIAVGTHDGNGGWQTGTILTALGQVVPFMANDATLLVRSTLPPEFLGQLGSIVDRLRTDVERPHVPVILNPEFTREGQAVHDFLEPERIVLGVANDPDGRGVGNLRHLYRWSDAPVLVMSAVDACLTKLGSNLFLATKISFANELAVLCDAFGSDVTQVVKGMSFDPRIGGGFLRAGIGFGGSCLPHQVSMTVRTGQVAGVPVPLLAAVDEINHRQRRMLVDLIALQLGGSLSEIRVALLGLSFKPDTDDLRDAPSLDIARWLLDAGATVCAYDPLPAARERAALLVEGLEVAASVNEAVLGVDAIALVTEWREFNHLDWTTIHGLVRQAVVVDGRNALDRSSILDAGFSYASFGRGSWTPEAAKEPSVLTRAAERLGASGDRVSQPVLVD
jgi:UDPglucose 6-dehydrogenase